MPRILPLFLFLALLLLQQARADIYAKNESLALPPAPRGSTIVIYPISDTFFDSDMRAKLSKNVTDCKDYMESQGMQFPKGGFAFYYRKPSILILCTTQKNHDLMTPMEVPSPK